MAIGTGVRDRDGDHQHLQSLGSKGETEMSLQAKVDELEKSVIDFRDSYRECQKDRDELLEALVDMVNQHCYCEKRDSPKADPEDKQRPERWVFDSGFLSANAYAMRILIKHGWAKEIGESHGRGVSIKITRWEA
jgi:hypothetical protein